MQSSVSERLTGFEVSSGIKLPLTGFTRKEQDEETGFYYYGARYLNPKTSMWISTAPDRGIFPIKYIDPTGRSAWDIGNKWTDVGSFKREVLSTPGAHDLMGDTVPMSSSEAIPGDIILMAYPWGRKNTNGIMNHVQIIVTSGGAVLSVQSQEILKIGR
jgi:RHS repeat-associated protein